jgi:hypothetical protein
MGDERTADWNDGATALSFKHELSRNIMITLEDVALSAKSRLPAMYAHREFVDVGGLMF